jgi:hypothetical protein
VDFDVHGVLGVRLLDGSASDVEAVRRVLGTPMQGLDRAADVVVRFVEKLPLQGATLVRSNGSTFTDEGFLILESETRGVRAQIPLWELGSACEIVCESGGRSVPMLMDAVRLAALKKGLIPITASAFEYEGVGVLVAGGREGGKTSALLAFARQGALFVGDGLIFVRSDGRAMFGLDTALSLTERQLEILPNGAHLATPLERLQVGLGERLERARRWAAEGAAQGSLRERLSAAIEPTLRPLATIERTSRPLFADAVAETAEPRQLFLTLCHDATDIRVKGVTTEDFVGRVGNLLHQDDLPLLRHHLDYRFAALGQSDAFVDRAHDLRRSLLERAFAGKEAFVLRRPRNVSVEALFKAMTRVRGDGPRGRTDFGVAGDPRGWRSPDRSKVRRSSRG